MCTSACVPVLSFASWPTARSLAIWDQPEDKATTAPENTRAKSGGLSRKSTSCSTTFGEGYERSGRASDLPRNSHRAQGRIFGSRSHPRAPSPKQPKNNLGEAAGPEIDTLSSVSNGASMIDAAQQLLSELDQVARRHRQELELAAVRHRQELNSCCDSWLRQLDDPHRSGQASSTSSGHRPDRLHHDSVLANFSRQVSASSTSAHPPTAQHERDERPLQTAALLAAQQCTELQTVDEKDNEVETVEIEMETGAESDAEEAHGTTRPSLADGLGGSAQLFRFQKCGSVAYEIARQKKTRKRLAKPFQELLQSRIALARESQNFLQRVFASRWYEWGSAMLILTNAIFIGVQTQYMANKAEEDAKENLPQDLSSPFAFMLMQFVFTICFTLELVLRWACDGFFEFFLDIDRWWNVLDLTVVTVSMMDLALEYLIETSEGGSAVENFSVLRVLRVVRIVRVARVIRIMKFFRELRMMIYSILGSMKSLLWVILVLVMTLFMFGITFTSATTAELDVSAKWKTEETESLRYHFGSVDRSLLSLFMAMSGGDDWSRCYDALAPLSIVYRYLFLLFISFAIFAVVNIVTGIFVETALQSNTKDREIVVHEELEAKKTYLKSLREVFDEMDEDDSGSISLEEFESKLDDERVIAYFNALKLDVSDASTLFWLLDFDHSNEVSIDEFLTGCYKLQGESRSLDVKLMQFEIRSLRQGFDLLQTMLQDVQTSMSTLCANKNGLIRARSVSLSSRSMD